ncbi:DUF1206 domain-containing protein [Lyngbya confervoides]|uniref:DUF1206 domain-containing protein n=1 Tax=Lyngbya confervoides BDU141951 TaxID=1574623 RepID=A0ABD4T2F9_9CYAN|nr:DUF1206 domain-containing protein [Lyngbya confervoides]MCM1982422.1 DUF1206 domain-containing protein [Lyngbya confervoides BDU141951]
MPPQPLPPGFAYGVRKLARLGYAAKGSVYFTAGILSGKAAFNWGGQAASSGGAIRAMGTQLPGRAVLGFIAFGLFSYALWRLVQALLDPEYGTPLALKNLAQRLGYAVNGLIYGGLGYTALRGFMGQAKGDRGDQSLQQWASLILSHPLGQWLLGTAGAFAIGLGFYYFYRALQKEFRKYLQLVQLSPQLEKWVIEVSRFGLTARGIVFVMIGTFLIQAAHYSDPSKVHSSEGILQVLDQTFYGSWLLGVVALGLVAYSIYMLIQAKYRRIEIQHK